MITPILSSRGGLMAGVLLATVSLTAVPAQTVITINGQVWDGNGGPLTGAGVVYHVTNDMLVPQGQTLTVQAGAILKFGAGKAFTVYGTLISQAPAVFTSIHDDVHGGDTNGNGPSVGLPGDWRGLALGDTADASVLQGLSVHFAGTGGFGGIQLALADATLSNCLVRDCAADGLYLTWTTYGATVTGCSFLNNGGVAVDGVPINAIPGFSACQASGNGGDFLRCSAGGATLSPLTIGPDNYIGGALVVEGNIVVNVGVLLTLLPGSVIKFSTPGARFLVHGTLDVQGVAAAPVVLTSFADDTYGGDTNNDGSSTGSPGDWQSLQFHSTSDASTASYLVVRHAGGPTYAAVRLTSADITLEDSIVELCAGDGIALNGSTAGATIARCTIQNNSGIALAQTPIDALAGLSGNVASGNGGNYVKMTSGGLGSDLTITRDALLGDVLVLGTSITVPPGLSLDIAPGVILKASWNLVQVIAQGSLDVLGTSFEPVVITSFADDRHGGDTNGDGPSSGAPADWSIIRYDASASTSTVENLIVAYPGAQGYSGFSCASPSVTVRALRVEHALGKGIRATALSGHALNWVAFDCGDAGIDLASGSFLLAHATAAHNAGAGILSSLNWSGTVYNAISWGNATNYSGFAAGEVQHSNGSASFAGTQGNIDADPLFEDPSLVVGDLRLQAGSPCLDVANDAVAHGVEKDWLENPRLLDSTLSGVMHADMGAHERAVWDLVLLGNAQIGTSFSLTTTGPPGTTIYAIGILDGTVPFPPYGLILAGQPQTLTLILVPFPVGFALPLTLPYEPLLVGYTLGIQGLNQPPSSPVPAGNMSRLYRGTIRF